MQWELDLDKDPDLKVSILELKWSFVENKVWVFLRKFVAFVVFVSSVIRKFEFLMIGDCYYIWSV